MSEFPNPYQTPDTTPEIKTEPANAKIIPAGKGARFANMFIDFIAQIVIGAGFGVSVALIAGEQGILFLEQIPDVLIGMPIAIGYYTLMEALTHKSLGKLITGTRVVSEDGGPPTFGQCLGRSFARMIPFEPFSVLFTDPARGWHDSLAKTYVVQDR
ncbi:MAG: RDD family protein [bacterium]|nr:RDD family protein [bacterium]